MCESDTLQKYKHLQNANIHQEMNLQKKQSARFLGSNYHNIHCSVYNSYISKHIYICQTW